MRQYKVVRVYRAGAEPLLMVCTHVYRNGTATLSALIGYAHGFPVGGKETMTATCDARGVWTVPGVGVIRLEP